MQQQQQLQKESQVQHQQKHQASGMNGLPNGKTPTREMSDSNLASGANGTSTPSNSKLKHLKLNKRLSVNDLAKIDEPAASTSIAAPHNQDISNNYMEMEEAKEPPNYPDMENTNSNSTLMRDALSRSKVQNVQLLANHTQLASQLEAKLRQEREDREKEVDSLQLQLKKEREKRER